MVESTIGIRELRQQASVILRRVQAGETIRVTDRGRPIALLTPLPKLLPLESLRAEGETIEPLRSMADLPNPIVVKGKRKPSHVLRELRSNER